MQLTVIIVNWNSKDYLRDCLRSLFATRQELDFEVIVIDSGSFDGSAGMVAENFPAVRFIQSDENLGFVRANNLAAGSARSDVLLFLNPDTEVRDQAFRRMWDALYSASRPGAIGAKLLNSDGTVQTSSVQAFPSILNQFLDSNILRRMFPRSPLWGTAVLLDESADPVRVDAVSGACLMVRKDLFESVGGFSTEYFMYSEDIDLCRILYGEGRINYYVSTAVVVHHGGGSSTRQKVSTFSSIMVLESCWRYFRKVRSPGYAAGYRMSMIGLSLTRLGILLAVFPALFFTKHRKGWRNALAKWTARLRWSLGWEAWARRAKAGVSL